VDPEAAHVHDDELRLYILGRLGASEVETLEQHVFHCPECKNRLNATARFVANLVHLQRDYRSSDRRSEPRFHSSDTGFLRSFAPLSEHRWPVQVVDVSRNGLGLLVPVRLSRGVLVQIQIGMTFALGEVMYSTEIGEQQFRTGIRLQDVLVRKT
jgi:hypothetical protein